MEKHSFLCKILMLLLSLLLLTGCGSRTNDSHPGQADSGSVTEKEEEAASDIIPGGVVSTLPTQLANDADNPPQNGAVTSFGPNSVSDPAGRQVVTLSVFYVSPYTDTAKAVAAFNQYSSDYFVEIHVAPDGVSAKDYWDKEMVEIVAGRGPDLFTKNAQTTFMTYLEKGILEDLTPYIDRDIDKEAYWENSLYAYAKNGKVYAIEPDFQLSFCMGDKELFEGINNWNLQEAIEFMKAHPEYPLLNSSFSPDSILYDLLSYASTDYSNYKWIRSALEFAKTYGNPQANGTLGPDSKASLLSPETIRSFLGFADCEAVYGGKRVPIGYINEQHSGVLHSSIAWSINSNSQQKEGAWAFLRFLLSEKYQRSELRTNFSPLKVIWEEQLAYYSTPIALDFYDPITNERLMYKHYLSRASCIPGCQKEIEYMPEDQLQTLTDLMKASRVNCFDWDITALNIITEEAAAYFHNQRTLDDVMTNIQSRMTLYLEEQK